MSENKNGIRFEVCGMPFKYFIAFFLMVMIAVYGGFIPTVQLTDGFVGASLVATIPYLMAIGGVFFWLGNTIPIVNNYLGGACLLPLIGASFLNFLGLVPQEMIVGTKILMKGGFQDMYISMVLVGSILVMDRKVLLGATARYIPTVIGSQVFAIGFAMLAGLVTGFGIPEALFDIAAPCMSGGSGGAITTLPKLYSDLSGMDMTEMAGKFLCYASIANVLAVVLAAVFNGVTKRIPGLNGDGQILRKGVQEDINGEKRPGTSADYKALGGGVFMAFCLYLLGNIFGHLPVLGAIPGLAWTIIFGIIIKCTGIMDTKYEDYTVYSMNLALRALLPMLIAGIGINSLKFQTLAEYFTPGAFIVILLAVVGAFVGACYAYWSKKISRTDKDFTLSEEEDFDLDNDLEPVSHREYVSLNRSEASSDAKDSSDSEDSSTDESPATSEGTIANETSSKPEKSSDSEVDASSDSEDMTE